MDLPRRVLFAGAHCDDIELFAGGLLSRACRTERAIGVVVFSDHTGVSAPEDASRARAELAANLRWLTGETASAIADHSELWLPACRGAFESERGAIYSALERIRDRYDLVVTHSPSDTNQDHRQVALEARRVFKAHATVLGGEFPANDVGRFRPQVYFALTSRDVDAKACMLSRYASQQHSGRPYFDESLVRGLARVRGSQIREEHAEAFEVVTRVVVRG